MQNMKQIKFNRSEVQFTGEDRFLVPGQKIKVKHSIKGDHEDYVVILQDDVTGAIVARRSESGAIVLIPRERMVDKWVEVYYHGIVVDDTLVFPGEVVLVFAFGGDFEAEYICPEPGHDLVRVRKISTGEVGTVSYDAISKKPAPKEYAEVGELVVLNDRPYIIALIDHECWALISIESGTRFCEIAQSVHVLLDDPGKFFVDKSEIVEMAERIGASAAFYGKINILNMEC